MPEHDLIVVVVRFTAASAITVLALIFVRLLAAKSEIWRLVFHLAFECRILKQPSVFFLQLTGQSVSMYTYN